MTRVAEGPPRVMAWQLLDAEGRVWMELGRFVVVRKRAETEMTESRAEHVTAWFG